MVSSVHERREIGHGPDEELLRSAQFVAYSGHFSLLQWGCTECLGFSIVSHLQRACALTRDRNRGEGRAPRGRACTAVSSIPSGYLRACSRAHCVSQATNQSATWDPASLTLGDSQSYLRLLKWQYNVIPWRLKWLLYGAGRWSGC